MAIWDTAGQERFHALGPIYYRDADGALLVYDITDQDSFLKVKNWVRELRKMLGKDIVLCIAGNKMDLERNRTVQIADAEQYASTVGALHFSTSAKKNMGVDEVFANLSKRMLEKARKEKKTSGSGSSGVPSVQSEVGGGLLIGDDEREKPAESDLNARSTGWPAREVNGALALRVRQRAATPCLSASLAFFLPALPIPRVISRVSSHSSPFPHSIFGPFRHEATTRMPYMAV
eukprot:CAMPEP_0119133830 /NCGR_PEP_ID=MMETSP1310-20130426/13891_1 /TAXON_ID=464262 /ORGANISM="Genus nov. species nov., Strain RCC2339" /LENGTH=232 /DNA_ID=CAMNT_0007124547 /DNA_START=206 /DNA_END=905 /DNA_ORIENTATION=-